MIRIAWRDALHHRRESIAVIAQIAVGIAFFVLCLAFVGGIGQNAERLLFGTVGASWLVEPGSGGRLRLGPQELAEVRGHPELRDARARLELGAALSAADETGGGAERSAAVSLVGTDLAAEPALAENFALPAERIDGDGLVLAAETARELGLAPGDELALRLAGQEIRLRLDAVAAPSTPHFLLENWALVDREALAERLYGDGRLANRLLLDAPAGQEGRRAVEAAASGLGQPVELSAWDETSWSSLMLGPRIWRILLIGLSSFAFLVVCIGLSSLVYSSLLSRARDLAVLKAAGASGGRLLRMQLSRICLQYLIGFGLGCLAALLAIVAVNAAAPGSQDDAFTFVVGSTSLRLVPALQAFLTPLGIGFAITLAVLWAPVRSLCALPVLELLEIR
ncbi:MAG: hypothetical protein Q4E05_06280 [Pseudoclavibacter sp.]|nr:hypothetical protein [Pseudoclavibacter sp.]